MAVLYVDEAGEEGFKDSSSDWFILGGALHDNAHRDKCCEVYDAFKELRPNRKDYFFHFQTRQHDERLGFIHAVREAPYQAMAVMVHKPSLSKPGNFQKKYYLYFYALRLLLERATKWADETAKEPLHLLLSSRKGLNDENLKEYFQRIKSSPFVQRDEIRWDMFKHDTIHVHKNKEYRGLQVADVVASSIYKAVEKSEYGTLEPRYISDLKPLFEREPYSGYQAVVTWPSVSFGIQARLLSWMK